MRRFVAIFIYHKNKVVSSRKNQGKTHNIANWDIENMWEQIVGARMTDFMTSCGALTQPHSRLGSLLMEFSITQINPFASNLSWIFVTWRKSTPDKYKEWGACLNSSNLPRQKLFYSCSVPSAGAVPNLWQEPSEYFVAHWWSNVWPNSNCEYFQRHRQRKEVERTPLQHKIQSFVWLVGILAWATTTGGQGTSYAAVNTWWILLEKTWACVSALLSAHYWTLGKQFNSQILLCKLLIIIYR